MKKDLELVKFNLTPSMSFELIKFNKLKKELNKLKSERDIRRKQRVNRRRKS